MYRQKCRHSEWVSDVYVGYLQFTRHLSACTYFLSRSLHISDNKITLIYGTLMYLHIVSINAEKVDTIKATPIQLCSAVNPFTE